MVVVTEVLATEIGKHSSIPDVLKVEVIGLGDGVSVNKRDKLLSGFLLRGWVNGHDIY